MPDKNEKGKNAAAGMFLFFAIIGSMFALFEMPVGAFYFGWMATLFLIPLVVGDCATLIRE